MALPSQDIQALANAAEERKRQEDSIAEEAVMTAGAGSLALFQAKQAAANLANEAAERIAKPLTHNQGGNLNARGPIGSNMPTNPASPATGPSGGTRLPSQPTAAEARTAQIRSAYSANSSTTGGFNTPAGTASTGTSGTSGTSATRSVLNKSKDLLNAAKNTGLAQGGKTLATRVVSAPVVQAAGYYQGGNLVGQGVDILGGYSDKLFGGTGQRPSEYFANLAEYMMERAYGTGLDAEGNPTGGAYDTKNENSLLGDVSDLFIKGVNNTIKGYDAVDRQLDRFGNYVMGGLQNSNPQVTQLSEEKVLPFQPAQGTPEVPMQNLNRGSSNKVPTSETEAEPLTGLDLYNDMYGKLMEKQGGKISDEQIKFARQRASEEGFGLDPEKGFFKQDFEGQDFEGQSIGEYLSVEFQPRKLDEEGNPMGSQVEIVGTEGMPVNFNPSSNQEMVKTLDPNTGEMMMADRETANAIADFYGRQRRGEALTRQEALGSQAMKDYSNRQLRNVIDSDYSRESKAREERLANKSDFNSTTGPKTYGGYTTSELRGMVGGGKALRRAQILAENGKDPLTGKDVESNEMSEYQRGVLELENKKFEQSKIDSAKPETMTPYQTEMVGLAKKKYEDVKAAAAEAAEVASAEGATQAQKDALDIAQKRVNLSQSYLDLVEDSEEVPEDVDLNFEKFESKLDVLEDTMDIEFDDRTKTFYKGRKGNTILPNSREGKIMAADPMFKLVFDQYPVKK
jgi:hypothetical protein